MNSKIRVEVSYALPDRQCCLELQLPAGSIVQEAIEQSGLLQEFGLNIEQIERGRIGIFGQKTSMDTPLRTGDRVEIYRPLLMSPTEARRLRAQTVAEKGDR